MPGPLPERDQVWVPAHHASASCCSWRAIGSVASAPVTERSSSVQLTLLEMALKMVFSQNATDAMKTTRLASGTAAKQTAIAAGLVAWHKSRAQRGATGGTVGGTGGVEGG